MALIYTVETINDIEKGQLCLDMDRRALAYVLSFVNPKQRSIAARQAKRHMFKHGINAKTPSKE
ncbi:hypothetical protein PAN31117_04389 [Pandoraea anapnoica]|uniref:Uncharacterized protein n=1 Tax=Pandoraea anapnoica TaxID=2508301 RepID=A0A5E5AHC2_9BURK|nr:hypothetical protein PAN31117_04389 [Pandoraea anapnoica]